MKVLVFPHHLEIGGSQVNAIDLAGQLRDEFGHDVVFFATPGPAGALLEERGLRLIEASRPRVHPSPILAVELLRAVRSEQPDLVHAWDWPQCLDAYFGSLLPTGVPLLGSIMSMDVLNAVPRRIPITMGTEQLTEQARRRRGGGVELLEPPVDTRLNNPKAVDRAKFRKEWDLDAGTLAAVVVSRLVGWLKLEGITRTIDAISSIAGEQDVRFIIVGGGEAAAEVQSVADRANERLGKEAIVLTGPLVDPRPAYAAADIVVGMGGSILRAMAFGKPCIILGEQGFSEVFDQDTAPTFFWQGYYGIGDGDRSARPLEDQLRRLLGDEELRANLGRFSAEVIAERYALSPVALTLDRLYREIAGNRVDRGRLAVEGARILARAVASAAVPHRARSWVRTVVQRRD